jgi:flavin reductase (DIM6/NTAB) family NADH-FMN oxidoreductase RutF
MAIGKQIRQIIRQLVFGDTLLPQEFTIGLADPQSEVSLWLHGLTTPVDVTRRYSMACAAPLTLCIAFESSEEQVTLDDKGLKLQFRDSTKDKRVLGEIRIIPTEVLPVGDLRLFLFAVRRSRNYCLSQARQWAHYLLHAYLQRKQGNSSGIMMSFLEKRSAMVMFIRPHPTSLGSVLNDSGGNIFPMNIMGELGNGYFAFALKDSRRAAHCVEQAGRIALSSVPFSHAYLPYQLAINHTKQSIEWNELPFPTEPSKRFGIPVPDFALRVKELEILTIRKIGSHTLFVARVVSDERVAEGLELCVIHGFYQYYRLKENRAELEASIVRDTSNKRALYPC